MLGMLIAGIVLKSCGFFQFYGAYPDLIIVSRSLALSVILITAGLALNPTTLRSLKFTVLRLAVIPCVCEVCGAALAAKFIYQIPWLWAFLIGFVLCPISPAVIIPGLLKLKEKGFGEDKGIVTLVIAVAAIDDILSISIFGVIMSTIFSPESSITMSILQGLFKLIGGFVTGCVWGLVCGYLGTHDGGWNQTALLGLGGFVAVVGSREFEIPGAGPLTAIISAFVANFIWNRNGTISPEKNPVADNFSKIWAIVQPALFGLIGPELDFTMIEASLLVQSSVIFLLSLVIRMTSFILCSFNIGLSWKEMLFLSFAWLPKVTIQAALAPQPLDQFREHPEHPDLHLTKLLFTTAVLAIIITAPIGSIGISLIGQILLKKPNKPNKLLDHNDS